MRLSILFSLLISFPLNSYGTNCSGHQEYIDDDNSAAVRSVKLTVKYDDSKTYKLSADQGGVHYFVHAGKEDRSYILMISLGPDYTKGVTAGLTWDKNNSMRISHFDGPSVYRLVCHK